MIIMDPDALSNIHKDYKTDLGFLLSMFKIFLDFG